MMYQFLLATFIICFIRESNQVQIEKITGPYALSEGPHWDSENNVLYFVDIPAAKIYCFNPATKKLTHTQLNAKYIGVAVPVEGKKNTFIAGVDHNIEVVSWDPKEDDLNPKVKILSSVEPENNNTRINDGKVDPKGRFWAGTMDINLQSPDGSLYRFDLSGKPTQMVTPVSISNGLTWSHDNKTFYYIDSPTKQVSAFDFDNESGNISNKRIIFDLVKNQINGFPDGMTIDKHGHLWVAVYDGSKVLEIDPSTGKLIQCIDMPAPKITSVAFGGSNLDTLYVTSARENMSEEDIKKYPLSGCVFAVHGLNVQGSPMLASKTN